MREKEHFHRGCFFYAFIKMEMRCIKQKITGNNLTTLLKMNVEGH